MYSRCVQQEGKWEAGIEKASSEVGILIAHLLLGGLLHATR